MSNTVEYTDVGRDLMTYCDLPLLRRAAGLQEVASFEVVCDG